MQLFFIQVGTANLIKDKSLSAEAAFLQLDRDGDKEVNLNEFIQWLKTAP